MGAKGSNKVQTQSSQTYTPDPRIQQAGYQALTGAESAAQLPFQMPQAPVAGFTPFQQQAFGATQQQLGMAQPYIGQGAQFLNQSAAPIQGQDVAQYYNPMAGNVFAQLGNIFGQQMRQTTGQATQAAGGVGADRIAIAQGNLANQQGLAAGQTAAGLYQQALQAAQQQKQMQAGAGYGLGQLGPAAQAAQLQSIGALGQAGAQQQALAQAQQNAQYQQQLAQIAYPFQTPQYLAGITGGLAPALGGTTQGQSTTTYPTPSALNQILGVGTSLLGLGGAGGMFGGGGGKGGGTGYGLTYGAPSGSWGSYGGVPYPTFARGGNINPDQSPPDPVGPPGSTDKDFADMERENYAIARRLHRASGGAAYGKIAEQHFANAGVGNPYASDDTNDYADGGSADDTALPYPGASIPKSGGFSPIPHTSLGIGAGHSSLMGGQGIDLRHQPLPSGGGGGSSGGSGGGGGNDLGSEIGAGVKLAATVLPFLLARGGGVSPYDFGQGFQEGGGSDLDDPDSAMPVPIQGIDAPMGNTNPHWTMGEVAAKARDYYAPAPLNESSPLNVRNWVKGGPFAEAKATPTPEQPTAAPAPDTTGYENPSGPQPVTPLPRPRPDIAGPAGQGYRSPQVPPASPYAIAQETVYAANKYGIPEDIALRLIRRESNFRNIRGAAGEYGPAQLMPGTARELGVQNPMNTTENIHGGMRYLRQMYDRYGDWNKAIAAYNAGPGAVDRGRIPASTQAYVADVGGNGKVDVNDLSARERTGPAGGPAYPLMNQDMTIQHGPRPYPGASQQDWGQTMARSPWMSLVKAGAAMATTAGPVGSAIGKGIAAGAGALDQQRKELRSEEDINQKADHLFQLAQQHLDKYQRVTPGEALTAEYHREYLRRTKYQPVNVEVTNDKGEAETVAANYDPATGRYFHPDGTPIEKGRLIARQTGAESGTSKAHEALTVAKDRVADYINDPNKTINEERVKRGLPPRGDLGGTPDTAIPYVPGMKTEKGKFYRTPDGAIRPGQ